MRLIYYSNGAGVLATAHQYHTLHELRRAGHDVIYVNPVEISNRNARPAQYAEALFDRVREEYTKGGLDLFFSLAWDANITTDVVTEIRRMGVPTVNWSADDYSHPFRVKRITSCFDLCWSTVRESAHIIKSYGARQLLTMPFAANPYFFKPIGAQEERVISFVGSAYGARARGLTTLAQSGFPVEVHGRSPMDIYGTSRIGNPVARGTRAFTDGWVRLFESLPLKAGRQCIWAALKRTILEAVTDRPENHPMRGNIRYMAAPDFSELVEILSRSALSFGSIDLSSTYVLRNPLLFIRWREFEAPMAGAVHLVNRFPELQEYFEEDREMLFYGSMEELVDKARFYLAPERDVARAEIRRRAAARARAEHTWLHRFRRIGDALGLKF